MTLTQDILAHARLSGFDLVGILPVGPPVRRAAFEAWLAAGYHGEMAYLAARAAERADIALYAPGARSLIVLAVNYNPGPSPQPLPPDVSGARIARYAVQPDYHDALKPKLYDLDAFIRQRTGRQELGRAFVDTAPVLERDCAERAGLGFIGRNTCLITPGLGSWTFLAGLMAPEELEVGSWRLEVGGWRLDVGSWVAWPFTAFRADGHVARGATAGENADPGLSLRGAQSAIARHEAKQSQPCAGDCFGAAAPRNDSCSAFFKAGPEHVEGLEPGSGRVEAGNTPRRANQGCGRCTRCLEACPTGAFVAPYLLDARRCISYLTIELRGPIPHDLRPLMGSWVFGCDICQEVCPYNRLAPPAAWAHPAAGRGLALPPLGELLALDEAGFRARFRGTPVMRAKRRGLVRNACVAAGNSGDAGLLPALSALLSDPEPLIRGHAAWALGRLGGAVAARALAAAAAGEADAWVGTEIVGAAAALGRGAGSV